MDWNLLLALTVAVGAFIGIVFSAALWLSRQFSLTRTLVYDKTEQLQKFIVDKLEYHERHDDSRFAAITKDLWELRVINAALNGKALRAAQPLTED